MGTTFRRLVWEDNLAQFESLDIPWFYVVALARLIDLRIFHVPLSFGVALTTVQRHAADAHAGDDSTAQRGASGVVPADHWDIAYPLPRGHADGSSKKLEHDFPREAGLSALILLLAELASLTRRDGPAGAVRAAGAWQWLCLPRGRGRPLRGAQRLGSDAGLIQAVLLAFLLRYWGLPIERSGPYGSITSWWPVAWHWAVSWSAWR